MIDTWTGANAIRFIDEGPLTAALAGRAKLRLALAKGVARMVL